MYGAVRSVAALGAVMLYHRSKKAVSACWSMPVCVEYAAAMAFVAVVPLICGAMWLSTIEVVKRRRWFRSGVRAVYLAVFCMPGAMVEQHGISG